ncbi:MAG: hypothetical protein AB7O26_00975 [Planctomycetaceae bacterium]
MSRSGVLSCGIAAVVLSAVFAMRAGADDSARKADSPAAKADATKVEPKKVPVEKPLSAQVSEEETIAFARANHPELADLLGDMKQKKSQKSLKEYNRAISQLNQTRLRLARIQKATPGKYELSLAVWKLDSRIQLLAARMTMSDEATFGEELKQLLSERYDARVKELEFDREQLAERLKKADQTLSKAAENREKTLQSELAKIEQERERRRVERDRAAEKAAAKSKSKKAKNDSKKSGAVSEP